MEENGVLRAIKVVLMCYSMKTSALSTPAVTQKIVRVFDTAALKILAGYNETSCSAKYFLLNRFEVPLLTFSFPVFMITVAAG